MKYSHTFDVNYVVSFVEARLSDIVEEIISSHYITGKRKVSLSISNYQIYSLISNLILNLLTLLDLLTIITTK